MEVAAVLGLSDAASMMRWTPGLGTPETFKFLGFTFILRKIPRSKLLVKRKTRRDCMRGDGRSRAVSFASGPCTWTDNLTVRLVPAS